MQVIPGYLMLHIVLQWKLATGTLLVRVRGWFRIILCESLLRLDFARCALVTSNVRTTFLALRLLN